MVEQLGLAMMRVSAVMVSALISGTTKGTFFSMRQAELLSMTKVPCSANCGAYCLDAAAPAGSAKTERLEKFRQTVAEWEDRAAYKLKEENDARESKRTTA